MSQDRVIIVDHIDHPPLLVSRSEAARLLSLSTHEIDNLRRAGKLLAKKYGSRVLFPLDELRQFADSLPYEVDLP